jgi:hypothetical protein
MTAYTRRVEQEEAPENAMRQCSSTVSTTLNALLQTRSRGSSNQREGDNSSSASRQEDSRGSDDLQAEEEHKAAVVEEQRDIEMQEINVAAEAIGVDTTCTGGGHSSASRHSSIVSETARPEPGPLEDKGLDVV